jgi:hypothetical protein
MAVIGAVLAALRLRLPKVSAAVTGEAETPEPIAA